VIVKILRKRGADKIRTNMPWNGAIIEIIEQKRADTFSGRVRGHVRPEMVQLACFPKEKWADKVSGQHFICPDGQPPPFRGGPAERRKQREKKAAQH